MSSVIGSLRGGTWEGLIGGRIPQNILARGRRIVVELQNEKSGSEGN